MYAFLFLVLHGSDPTVDAPMPTEAAASKAKDTEPATKSPQKKPTQGTTKKAPKTKPSARPLAKPEPAPRSSVKPVPAKSESKQPAAKPATSGAVPGTDRPRDDDRHQGSHDREEDRGSHDGDRDHGAHDNDRDHDAHDRDHDSHGGGGGHEAHDGRADHDRPPVAHPPHRSSDHRYARPTVHHLPRNRHAHAPPPAYTPYRGWYTHWWVHPYWRWQHATIVVVTLPFVVDPWADAWIPPARHGWAWVPGHFEHGFWVPGHWAPVGPPVAGYTYVPGYWFGDVYVSGYYRVAARDSWRWVDGRYGPAGAYVPGHWHPTSAAPDGYTWEPGFFDGEVWVEGYWRPLARAGFRWIPARTTDEGVRNSGYWEPVETRVDHVWVPGWFDGNQWVEGYWVTKREYDATDPSAWEPEPGWDADEEGGDDSSDEGPPVAIAVPAS